MGGNAIKKATRLDAEDYYCIEEGIVSVLKSCFPKAMVVAIPAYDSKSNFGDLDVLISGIKISELKEFAEFALLSDEIIVNGNVISFALETTALIMKSSFFQVDFIVVEPEQFLFAFGYFSYNDLGNLIGQTAHGIGLKFGHDGLWYKYMIGSELIKEILITQDFSEALDFLGYDPDVHKQGFDTLEEIFKYVTTSSYFTTYNYKLENRNAVGRVRDKKRATYMQFLDWLDGKNFPSDRLGPDSGVISAIWRFPDTAISIATETILYHRKNRVKAKFNGDNIHAWTGLTDKALGDFIEAYRSNKGFVIRLDKVDRMSLLELEQDVKQFFKGYTNGFNNTDGSTDSVLPSGA